MKALWEYEDDTVTEAFLVKRQQMHVSILSFGSFLGRLMSGQYPYVPSKQAYDLQVMLFLEPLPNLTLMRD